MKHFKLFFALFAMLALGVGNAWAQTVTWEKATSIAAGDVVALVCESKKMELSGISTTSTKYGTGVAYTSAPVGKYELTVEEGKSSGTFSLKNGSNYLYWTSGNSLNKTTTKDANASWTITFSNGNAIIKNANTPARQLQWNASSPRFACYDNSGQTPVQLYKKVISDEPADVIVKTLESIAVEGMTINYETGDMFKFDGTCTATYSVTKNDVPQEDETKEVTPTSVSTPDMSTAGEKEVTVTYTEDDVTVTATYTINVTENSIYPGTYALALNNTFFGTTAGVAVSAFPTTAKQDDITVTLNGAGNKTRTDADCVRMYDKNTLTFSVPAGYVITSIEFAEPSSSTKWDGSITADPGTYSDGNKSWAGSAQEVVFSFGAQNRIATATVTYAEAGETPEVPTLDAPTFSLAADTYNEAKEVILSAEEGTIYYTLDGTTPDAESTKYTEPIVLNECGTTTIKAIAISGEITSSVASATYTIKLPLNNSQANPYTEADAIEVFDGGCYDNQDVYVTGVVANAQFYSSNTYTITLEGGFQFYKFYEAVGEVTFTEDYIVAGDTLVACGKLDNYKGTYQLAAGCYLVERKPYSAPKVDISNTPETAYTVAEAIALIDNVTSDLTKQVYVKGEISEIDSYNETYGSITYWIKDEEENTFQCYSGLGLNSEQFESVDDLVVGSQVVVYGTLKKHNSTYEFNYNNYIVSLTLPSYTVTVTAENGTVEGLAADGKYEHGAEATLTAIPAEGYEFTCWTAGKDTVSTENSYTFTVTADVALVANFAVVEPEVIAYELNGGELPTATVPTQEELWASFKTATGLDTKALSELSSPVLNTIAGLLKGTTWYEGFDVLEWKWLKSYIQTIQANQAGQQFVDANGTTRTVVELKDDISSDDNWRFAVAAFFAQSQYVGWPTATADFTEAGKPEAWGAAYQATHAVVLPTEPVAEDYVLPTPVKTGYTFVGWYDNEEGTGEAYTVIPAGWSGTLYAIWKQSPATALENIAVEGKVVKAIINGQLIIVKNGVQYNAQGQVIK